MTLLSNYFCHLVCYFFFRLICNCVNCYYNNDDNIIIYHGIRSLYHLHSMNAPFIK